MHMTSNVDDVVSIANGLRTEALWDAETNTARMFQDELYHQFGLYAEIEQTFQKA